MPSKKPSARIEIPPFKLLVRGVGGSQTNLSKVVALGCPLELDGRIMLLKTHYIWSQDMEKSNFH